MKLTITTIKGERVTTTTAEGSTYECTELVKAAHLGEVEVVEVGDDCASMEPADDEEELQEESTEECTEEQPEEEKPTLDEQIEQILEEGDPKHYRRDSEVPVSDEEDDAWNEAMELVMNKVKQARANGIPASKVKEAFNG